MYVDNCTGSDYYTPPSSVRFSARQTEAKITIRTREDSIMEQKLKYFIITAKHPLVTDGSLDCTTKVAITDDDGMY